jgi:uncharacterized protein
MVLRSITRVALVIVLGTSGLFLASMPAQAATNCDTTVVDSANILGSSITQVEDASKKLESLGADVRVRTVKSFAPAATLDDYVQGLQSCPSWQSPNGSRKSNIVIFAMSMQERKVGIFYGSKWDNAFTGANSETRIYEDYMAPQFKGGNFSQGFVDGINQTDQVLNNYLHPSAAQSEKSGSSSGSDGSTGWIVLIIFGSLVALALIGLMIFLIIRARRKGNERRAARLRALRARDAASTILQQIGDANRIVVRKAKVAKYSAVGKQIADQLSDAENTVSAAYERATRGMLSAAPASATADDERLSVDEYDVLETAYEQVLDDAQKAQDADNKINKIASDIDRAQADALAAIADVQARAAKLETSLEVLSKAGIVVDAIQAPLDKTHKSLEAAIANQGSPAVLANVAQARQDIADAETAEQTLGEQRTALETGLPTLKGRIDVVANLVEPAQKCFERIESEYVKSSWYSVAGNGTEATKRIQATTALLNNASNEASPEKQQWDKAVKDMQQGNQLLTEAESLLNSITALEQHLATARQQAPQEISDAEADITKAARYINDHKSDVHASLKDDLNKAKATLADAQKEFAQSSPDYLQVIKLAQDANSHADSIYEAAASDFDSAERLRRQAVSSLQTATAAVSKAQEYIQDHHKDVHSGAKNILTDAQTKRLAAQNAANPADIIRKAKAAEQAADDAYNKAHHDFRKAENNRDDEQRQRNNSNSGFSTGLGAGVGFGIGSSWGSSSSNDSFSGGGGGSSGSFGGDNSGGGSSGGW